MKLSLSPFKSRKRNARKECRRLLETGLFQPAWYSEKYQALIPAGMSPEHHYVTTGEQDNCQPNPYFDPHWYLSRSGAARRFEGPALVHYAQRGWKKGHSPSPRFSSKLYLAQYPDVQKGGMEPLAHYLHFGRAENRCVFEHRLSHPYYEKYIDIIRVIHDSGIFAPDWYKQYYTDLWNSDDDMLAHFVITGSDQHRHPNPYFDTYWYLTQNSDAVGDENPVYHYVTKGYLKGLKPHPNFDADAYFKDNPDLDPKTVEPLSHYLNVGLHAGSRSPLAGGHSGTKKTAKLDAEAKLPVPDTLRAMTEFKKVPLAKDHQSFNPTAMNIHWVIPDFVAGGGGHMTIFRMVSFLEAAGHRQTLWINAPSHHETPEAAQDDICKYFQHFVGEVKFLDSSFADAEGDALIATDCWTVWPALSAPNFIRRFYFVQDFEPSFHAVGSYSLAAEATYKEDLDCICAGPWLEKLMTEEYDRWARHFWLAADMELYHPPVSPRANTVPRIAFYARHFTARRAVELAMLALEVLAKRGVEFEVDFFGAELDLRAAPFKFKDHGVASPETLAKLFQKADIGIVFSATNYSLVPQEMMASGLPIVELNGENTSCIFPPKGVSLADPDPMAIADAVERLILNPDAREAQAKVALEWVAQFSWAASAELVETALKDRLGEFATDSSPKERASLASLPPKASVVIPTLNAGPVLDRVLAAATSQRTPWPYEVLVIDSGSTDETLETVARYPSVKLHQIEKKDFNHGGTRNLGVELTSGEFVAFLTHDALPANGRWLFNLVSALEFHPEAAGVFGKHLAWPDASPFTKRDMNAHFELFNNFPLYVDKNTNKRRYRAEDPQWRQFLHFYSDNNSCMRRSVWQKIPYREVKFGEDQLWADDIIAEGYGKVYAPQAIVVHSHDYDAKETYERTFTETAFFKHFFGYELIKDKKAFKQNLKWCNEGDETFAAENKLGDAVLEERLALNEARLRGQLDGTAADTNGMF